MSWKLALYDFVHARNQMEVDYEWSGLRTTVADEAYLQRTEDMQERRRRLHRERGLMPVQSETRLRIRNITAGEEKVTAEIRLYHQLEAQIMGIPVTEEREERETVTLRYTAGSKWMVSSIQAEQAEGMDLFAAANGKDLYANHAQLARPSVPLLNRGRVARDTRSKQPRYNREQVRLYAERFWNSYNPQFLHFDVDCSNYVSQCLLAGGVIMDDTGRRNSGWWYRGRSGSQELWSYSWAVANALQGYLGSKRAGGIQVEAVDSPQQLKVGDVISYSWEGDGRYGHSTIVTGFDPKGMPLVNAHTVNSRNRYWDYSDSYAWTERTKYRFFHIMG
jgi:hypothetical protein